MGVKCVVWVLFVIMICTTGMYSHFSCAARRQEAVMSCAQTWPRCARLGDGCDVLMGDVKCVVLPVLIMICTTCVCSFFAVGKGDWFLVGLGKGGVPVQQGWG